MGKTLYKIKNLRKGIAFFFLTGMPALSFAQIDSTTAEILKSETIQTQFGDNLDSTLNLWYVQSSEDVANALNSSYSSDTSYYLPDSVYASRLEKLPYVFKMTYNPIVRKYIEMYTQKKRDRVCVMLGLADYYFPIFDDIFDYYGVPNEIKYMAIIESALNPRARSRTRAIGLWQFMYGTAKMYDLRMNSTVDERHDPIKETHAAARFSKDLFEIYGDWQLVVAAYNCGPGNVNKAIRRSGGKRDFWEIYRYLPRETRGHVPAFIAAAYLMNYYKEHNLVPITSSFPKKSDTLMINENLHLEQVAEVLKLPIDQIRDMNPQYIRDIIPAKNSYPMPLMLPLEHVGRFIDLQDSIYAYKSSFYFNPDNLRKEPELYAQKGKKDSKKHGNLTLIRYTVKSGDNLGLISEWYNCRINDILDWNNMRSQKIRSGQKLAIYVPDNSLAKYKKINQMSFKQKQQMKKKRGDEVAESTSESSSHDEQAVTAKTKETTEKIEASNKNNKSQTIYYTVKQGDTLWGIAKKYPGISGEDLRRWNNISRNQSIMPGQQLVIKVM